MGYHEFTITAPEESKDAIISRMRDLGSSGFIEQAEKIIAYFDEKNNIAHICEEMESFKNILRDSGLNPDFSFEYALMPDKDWNEEWKKQITAIDIGENLTIVPSWMEDKTGRVSVIIDSGMVFGTGHHETTRSCLILIEKYSKEMKGKSLLDIGTGSGILAIAASRLGFGRVVGIDTDAPSVESALENIGLNELRNIAVREGTIYDVKDRFDMITANLISETLIEIAPEIKSHMNPDGIAILSGMLSGQEDDVSKAMEDQGLKLKEKLIDGKWITLVVS